MRSNEARAQLAHVRMIKCVWGGGRKGRRTVDADLPRRAMTALQCRPNLAASMRLSRFENVRFSIARNLAHADIYARRAHVLNLYT